MTSLLKKLPPSVIALLLQSAAFSLVWLSVRPLGLHVTALVFALLCGTLAAALSRIAGLARWWLFIQLAFAPALVLVLALGIPPGFFLAAFFVMLAVYWSTFRTQVPLYLSSKKIWQALERLLPSTAGGDGENYGQGINNPKSSPTLSPSIEERKSQFTFVDLGSGIGGVLTHLAQTHPQGHYHGVEAAPLPFIWSWLRIKFGGYRQCTVHWGSLWGSDLSRYDVVFAYLSPVPMGRLWHKAKQEMRPGSLFISNTFAVPDHPPQETVSVDDLHRSTLYLWRM
ncbi:MAG: class I SAM-dependent methyltransferase [Sideroxyarcus sp.]|nr:class I SAM-dependent methyltransferase [Sideroxyarcus sp.]